MNGIDNIDIFLPDLRGGGAERVCLNLANEFAGRGLPVRMVLMRAKGELVPLLNRRVEVVDLGAKRVRNVLWPLVQHLRQARPAALLANMWPLTFVAVLARLLARVDCRVVAVERTTWSATPLLANKRTSFAFKASMRWLQPRADALLAVSRGAADDLERLVGLPPGSVQAQYNPIAISKPHPYDIAPERETAWWHGDHRRLLAVGTLKAVKDFPTLLRAFARLREQANARLLILGEGEGRAELESLVQSLGLSDAVELPGFVGDPGPYYAKADLFVLSSDHEGFGNVIPEALGRGVPVVSTDCPSGPREILCDGKYGALVPVGDAEALAQAMLASLQSTHDPAALKARARDFAVDTIAEQYLDHLLPGWREAGRSA